MITIEHYDDGTHGLFKALEDGVEAGRMKYSWKNPSVISIDHTEVDPAWKGRGIGKHLVMEGVRMARKDDLKIIPLCPYAKALMEKDKELQDVLFKS